MKELKIYLLRWFISAGHKNSDTVVLTSFQGSVNVCGCRKYEWISSLLTSLQPLTQTQSCRVSIYRLSARSVSRDVLASFLLPLFLLSILLARFFCLPSFVPFPFLFFSSLPHHLIFLFIFPSLLFQFILSCQIHFLYGYLFLIPLIHTH